jgi:outer membrane lipoprotein carrier protein
MLEKILALATFLHGGLGLAQAPDPAPAKAVVEPARVGAREVVSRVQVFYEKNDRLSAKFRQYYTNVTFGRKTTSDGKVYIKKPGKMRWDYYRKVRGKAQTVKSFISDGAMLWAVEHDNKQVFKKDLETDLLPVAITFLYGKGDLSRDFSAALDPGTHGQPGDYVLALTPKQPSAQYKTLWLVVDATTFRVRESIVLEASGNTNHFRFFHPDMARTVEDTWFAFDEKAAKNKKYRIVEPEEELPPGETAAVPAPPILPGQ